MEKVPQKKTFNLDKVISKLVLIGTIVVTAGLLVFAGVSIFFLAPVDKDSDKTVEFVVKEGTAKYQVAEELDKANLIKNAFFFKFYMKINEHEVYAGTYLLSKSMSVDEIIKLLNSGNSIENETLTVTFIEGRRLMSYADKINETFDIPKEEIIEKLSDLNYLESLIEQYWFLNTDILNDKLYHPLEGYLFPDTYIMKKNSTLEEVITRMLNNMDTKLSIYKDEITLSTYSVHELLTLASIIELEGANSADRTGVAGVFYNRLRNNETLGSDVTTYYAVNKTFAVDLTMSDLNSCNDYNTRGSCVPALPIGPIASPSLASIAAAIEPDEHDYNFFVADKSKKTYFSKTLKEHNDIIAKLKAEGNWLEY